MPAAGRGVTPLFCAGKLPEEFSGCVSIGIVRSLCCFERTKVFLSSVQEDRRLPIVHKLNALKSRFVRPVTSGVHRILRPGSQPQVGNPVVGTVSIDVINLVLRPIAVNVKPSKPMGHIRFTVDSNGNMATGSPAFIGMPAASNLSRLYLISSDTPPEKTGFGLVIKKRMQALLGNDSFGCRHGAGLPSGDSGWRIKSPSRASNARRACHSYSPNRSRTRSVP